MYHTPHFIVYSDNNSLTYILSTVKHNSTGHRSVDGLSEFIFSIKDGLGKNNADTDSLSRTLLDINEFMKQCTEEVSQEVISASAQGVSVQRDTPPTQGYHSSHKHAGLGK